jgi:hypothetical protein
MTMQLNQQLESLKGYLENLIEKHGATNTSNSWHTKKIANKTQTKEINRVRKKIDELSRCKRHLGINGLDCFACELEGKF